MACSLPRFSSARAFSVPARCFSSRRFSPPARPAGTQAARAGRPRLRQPPCSWAGRRNHSACLCDSASNPARGLDAVTPGSGGPGLTNDWENDKAAWQTECSGNSGIQTNKASLLTLEKLLRNLPRLGGCTQRVHPGAHPIKD